MKVSLLLASAEQHAFAGHANEALADLGAAEDAFQAIDAGYGRPHAILDELSLYGYRGSCLQMLHRPREALEAMAPALSRKRVPRARAVALTESAAANGQLGELDESCALLGEALDIAADLGLVERARRVASVRRLYLGPKGKEPFVRRLDERLAAIL